MLNIKQVQFFLKWNQDELFLQINKKNCILAIAINNFFFENLTILIVCKGKFQRETKGKRKKRKRKKRQLSSYKNKIKLFL